MIRIKLIKLAFVALQVGFNYALEHYRNNKPKTQQEIDTERIAELQKQLAALLGSKADTVEAPAVKK